MEDRSAGARAAHAGGAVAPERARKPLPGAENAGKPGYYTVRPGDTLIRIALETGQNWRDIARWNNIDNPNVIEVGQVLRVIPPPAPRAPTPPRRRAVATGAVRAAPRRRRRAAAAAARPRARCQRAAASRRRRSPPPADRAAAAPRATTTWPGPGRRTARSVLAGFDEAKNKGLDIGGKAGDPVLAAADGRVVYAGAGLRGYGNLIILKHNNTYLTAYAHNQALLVKEDQTVRKGQKIAEMGSSDADRVKLHFEIRRQGKPVDPARYLPPR